MMCADVSEEGSLCIGDEGGPLVTQNSIVSYFIIHNVYFVYGYFHLFIV